MRQPLLVPGVSSKFLVYGGSSRQSRSDCEVVPLAEFSGVLERFEVDQELGQFVEEMSAPVADKSDVEILDTVYRVLIRPTIGALESASKPLGDALFRDFTGISHIRVGQTESNGSNLLEAKRWGNTRDRYIVGQGFRLADDQPIDILHHYRFNDYNGMGTGDFSLLVIVAWTLKEREVVRRVTIDGEPISSLNTTVGYSEIDDRAPDLDRVGAVVNTALMDRIKSLVEL